MAGYLAAADECNAWEKLSSQEPGFQQEWSSVSSLALRPLHSIYEISTAMGGYLVIVGLHVLSLTDDREILKLR